MGEPLFRRWRRDAGSASGGRRTTHRTRSPAAILVMGRWYDPAHHETDASPFERPSIEIAARYYSEAAEAGAEGAERLLRDVCTRLDPNDFMQNDAIETHCSEE